METPLTKNPWKYNGQEVEGLPDACEGFVYLITCHTTGRAYIGKKFARHKKTSYYQHTYKNGVKKRRKRVEMRESDWRGYWGSSQELTRDLATLGVTNFTREILYYCASRSETTYMEAREQFLRNVLLSDQYYNGQIQCRINKRSLQSKKPL